MATSTHSPLPVGAPTAGIPGTQTRDLASEDRDFLHQIAQEIHPTHPQTWKRHWKARYGLPPHPHFVRFVKHEAPTLSPAELLRHLEREHHLEIRAQAALRPDFRHAQPDRYRVLLREIREGLRDTIVPPTPTLPRAPRRKRPGNPFSSWTLAKREWNEGKNQF